MLPRFLASAVEAIGASNFAKGVRFDLVLQRIVEKLEGQGSNYRIADVVDYLRTVQRQSVQGSQIQQTMGENPDTVPALLYDPERAGEYNYHTIVTVVDSSGHVVTIPVNVSSSTPMNIYEIQSASYSSLENDRVLQDKYGIATGFTIKLDSFYVLRAY